MRASGTDRRLRIVASEKQLGNVNTLASFGFTFVCEASQEFSKMCGCRFQIQFTRFSYMFNRNKFFVVFAVQYYLSVAEFDVLLITSVSYNE